jgi:hypothetical protein
MEIIGIAEAFARETIHMMIIIQIVFSSSFRCTDMMMNVFVKLAILVLG